MGLLHSVPACLQYGDTERPNGPHYVKMPSGKRELLSYIGPSAETMMTLCNVTSLGRREEEIISRELQSSIRQHVNCANGGGCYSSYNIIMITKLVNTRVWERYEARKRVIISECGIANEQMLFHGTAAVLPIALNGFDTTRARPSGLFGAGIYFAPYSSKSNQYVLGFMGGRGCAEHRNKSCNLCPRMMLLCRVALGKVHETNYVTGLKSPPAGHHSIKGTPSPGGLQFTEYSVYDSDQAYPEYVIMYKIVT